MPSHAYIGRAIKDLANLDPADQDRIDAALVRLVETRRGDVKKLRGCVGEYRLRVGKWRAFFRFRNSGVIEVFRIDNRGEAY